MTFSAAEPCLFVRDFDRARSFYEGRLGFTVELTYGDPPHFGIIARGAARLSLRCVAEPVYIDDVREREQLLAASLTMASSEAIDTLFDAWSAAGVPMFQPLRTEPWGARTFILRDPDGNLVLVASPA